MDKEKLLRYGLIALSVLIALVGAYFGVKLPYPELPEVQDLSGIEARLDTLESDVDAAILGGGGTGGAESFGIGAAGKTNVAWLIANQVTGKNLIESQGDLTVADDATITDDAAVGGDLAVTGALSAGSISGFVTSTVDSLTVNGNALITGTLTVSGTSDFNAAMNVDANGDFDSLSTVSIDSDRYWDSTGSVQITDNAVVTGTLQVDGETTINDDVNITGTLTVDGGTDFNAAMNVDANGDFDSLSTVSIDSDRYWDSTGSVQITDNAVVTGTLQVDGETTINDDATITGTLTVDGKAFFYDLDVAGDSYFSEPVDIDALLETDALTVTNEIQFGANGLYPLGVGVSGFQIGFGSVTITGTAVATHTTGTPYVVLCTLEEFSIDHAFCTAIGATGVVTATVYDITGTEATAPVNVNWLIIGIP